MSATVTVLTVEDVVASAVATAARTAVDVYDAPRQPGFIGGAIERLYTISAATRAGLDSRTVWDQRCARRFDLIGFVRHCAEVDHTIRDVVVDEPVPDERWLGRQGESKTAVSQW